MARVSMRNHNRDPGNVKDRETVCVERERNVECEWEREIERKRERERERELGADQFPGLCNAIRPGYVSRGRCSCRFYSAAPSLVPSVRKLVPPLRKLNRDIAQCGGTSTWLHTRREKEREREREVYMQTSPTIDFALTVAIEASPVSSLCRVAES